MTSFCLKSGPEEPARGGGVRRGEGRKRSRQYAICVMSSKCLNPAASSPEL